MEGSEWPSRPATVRMSTLAAMSWVAVKCRRSWRRTSGALTALRTQMNSEGQSAEHHHGCQAPVAFLGLFDDGADSLDGRGFDALGGDGRRLGEVGDVGADPAPAMRLVERQREDVYTVVGTELGIEG